MKPRAAVLAPQGPDARMLDALQCATFDYFRNEINPRNGLIADKTQPGSPASIADVGLGLTVYLVAVERGWLSRQEAIVRTMAVLKFFQSSRQGPDVGATGY